MILLKIIGIGILAIGGLAIAVYLICMAIIARFVFTGDESATQDEDDLT